MIDFVTCQYEGAGDEGAERRRMKITLDPDCEYCLTAGSHPLICSHIAPYTPVGAHHRYLGAALT